MIHKYLTFLLATYLCSAATYAAQIPYRSTIGDKNAKAISSEWTLVDHNNDKKTWTYDNDDNNLTKVTGCDCGVKYSFSSNNDGDDWLFSPSISLKAATEYHNLLLGQGFKHKRNGKSSCLCWTVSQPRRLHR